ncbi:MAG: DeoR/GlpR family DNA-binding transcription regulator [Clostridia bacterium]
MSVEDRKQQILNMLDKQGSVSVSELSEIFAISEVSIRKMLIAMEKEQLLQRRWGGAIKPIRTLNELTYQMRETKYLAEKKSIAKLAYDSIEDGDSIYLDAGTTTYELAKLIRANCKHKLLVATNALDHARELIGVDNITIILVGGEVRQDVRSCAGYFTKDTISQMIFDKGFIGTEHISVDHGITTPNMREAELKRSMLASSKKGIILADYSKFWNDSLIQVAPIERAYQIITDWRISREEINQYKSQGINLVVSEAPTMSKDEN